MEMESVLGVRVLEIEVEIVVEMRVPCRSLEVIASLLEVISMEMLSWKEFVVGLGSMPLLARQKHRLGPEELRAAAGAA